MGITEVLTLVFVVLKLLDIVNWSWWLVLLPEIIAMVVYVGLVVISFAGVGYVHKRITKKLFSKWDF